ncbi:DNA ligase D [Virgibacillus dakarensis]|uniref:DNA ligase D n=1 Tax=Virgibacillus dakarensis TaxID=1917889 RepID=UPI000B454D14|nr:DNA ligase D [Virgibacillus dakarensis]
MHVMKPIASTQIPADDEWLYEVKYDGFRCVLDWQQGHITLTSKNNKDLTPNFPEIADFCLAHQEKIQSLLPLRLDGELVVLNNPYQANFSWIQKRGRLKDKTSIKNNAQTRPATFLAFDITLLKGKDVAQEKFQQRKDMLQDFFKKGAFPFNISSLHRLCYVPYYENHAELWDIVFTYKGEGIVAKRKNSVYGAGKHHNDWFKIKNWRQVQCVLSYFDPNNDYFTANVYENNELLEVGKCKHSPDSESIQTLKQLFTEKGSKSGDGYKLPPAICAEIHTLDLLKSEIREPEFARLLVNTSASDCTLNKLRLDMAMLPDELELSNTDKVFWPKENLTKRDLLIYLREISPYMLPFLKEHALTLIRCPDGVSAESFFQKHLPDYAPPSIDSMEMEGETFIVCNKLDALLWFGNHGAIEYHVPFQKAGNTYPSEIVFDLDPPDREGFSLAVVAAKLLKQILDDLELAAFVKTSGNKGLQVHIPIPEKSISYEETALFTQAIAKTIEQEYPQHFTTERMKKNRHGRLYIDYVQHGRNKTIIAPYSPRKTEEATVATPLFWEELQDGLSPIPFTIANTVERVKLLGCPFAGYFIEKERQNLEKVIGLIGK